MTEPTPETQTTPAEAATAAPRSAAVTWAIRIVVLGLVVTGVTLLIKHTRHYVIPKRFQEIEAGLYRSGQLERYPYDQVLAEHEIKTVLRLNPWEDDPVEQPGNIAMDEVEKDLVAKTGVGFVYIPMQSGSGIVPYEKLDAAADLIAQPERRPLLFHCYAGSRRSAAVHAAYRLKHCGYTWERTVEELRDFGLTKPLDSRIYKHLDGYRAHLERQSAGAQPPPSETPSGEEPR